MVSVVPIEQIKNNLKESKFLLHCNIPLGYSSGFPVLQIRNDCLCVTFPYLKYQTTGEVDKTLVYPIRYAITLELPTEKIISFEDYEYKEEYKKIDFDKPVGFFRHEAIKDLNKKEYFEARKQLMLEYDKVINSIFGNSKYTRTDEERMRKLLKMLIEPSLLPMYRVIDKDFYEKYLSAD